MFMMENQIAKIEEAGMNKQCFLFANISYCFNGDMGGHFRYIKEMRDAGEKYNFEPLEVRGEKVCWGFFEPGFTKGGYDGGGRQRHPNLGRIDASFKNSSVADGITVIWCAQIDEIGGSSIIGWYKDAKVYRDIKTPENCYDRCVNKLGYGYNVEALAKDCMLLPKDEILSGKWSSPRKKANGFGFGQSNMWYAEEPSAQKYVIAVLGKISNYSGKNEILSDSVHRH